MPYLPLRRLGHILGAMVIAVLIAWTGSNYNSRSGQGNSHPAGVRLVQLSTLKVERGHPATPQQMWARSDWAPLAASSPTGWTNKNLWARLELANTTPVVRDIWLEVAPPRLAHVQLHQRTAQGTWRSDASGLAVPTTDRQINVPDVVFALQLQPHEKRVVLLHAENNTPPLNMAFALHDPVAYVGTAVQSGLTDLLLIGATMALGLICLFIGLVLRQPLQIVLGLRSLLLGSWLLLQLGFLALILPSALAAAIAQQIAWMAWLILLLTTVFVWLFLAGVSTLGVPKWAHRGFSILCGLCGLSAMLTLLGLQQATQLVLQIGLLGIVMTVFTLLLSAWMVWRGQTSAVLIVLTSCTALLINSRLHLSVLGVTQNDVLRHLTSPIPVLLTTAVFFVGITVQLLRERQTRQALRWQGYQQAMALLEDKVVQRTEALQVARDEAQQANAAKSLFMAKISHELRTPMHAVLGYVGLVLRDKPPQAIARRLQVAQRAGQQLVGQIDDLLDYVRVGQDQLRVSTSAFDLSALQDSVVQRANLLATESGNQFHSTQGANLPAALLGDSLRIEQVLMVLLANAMRYTQHGSVTLHIAALDTGPSHSSSPPMRHLQFCVSDTGCGIAPEARAHIFELFERGGATDRDGLGLGLPIAQHILGLMGSGLHVRSQPGQGSEFSFTLDLACADAPQPSQALDAPAGHGIVGYSGPTLRILLLEDDLASSQYLQELLTDLGFSVSAFDSVSQAQEAVRALAASHGADASVGGFDLYIVDQHLGQGTVGWDFVRYVRSAPELPAAWCSRSMLMLSATQALPPSDWNPQHTVNQHLLKPISERQLIQVLTQHLQPQWIAQEASAAMAPAPAPWADAQHWSPLHQAARVGSVSQLNQWREHHPALVQAHPEVQAMINRLDFALLAQYAQAQLAALPE